MRLQDLKWPEVDALSRDVPIVAPIAAVEQHGPHLPVFTDSMLLGEVARRAEEALGDRAVWAPLLWLGNSHHHMDFPGTVSAEPRTYLDVLAGLVENFLHHGFRRIVFLNGHGGNIVPSSQAVFEARQRHRDRKDLLLLSATYWATGPQPPDLGPDFEQDHMEHACEWETSMILRLAPHLVGPIDSLKFVSGSDGFAPAAHGWTTRDRSEAGYIGRPRHAGAEKGERLFQHFSAEVVAFLEKVVAWDGRTWAGNEGRA
ncbi:creatininase family protein [Paludisphaera mucosa]|uniref:Creatininase family protein n=1 Tax=Paludisphaera mucosa TaxID=3030827 RepID=A0ABT6FBV6_9BACT|nr:creatininase family protein [Paludisphaera mucosa]MDG3005073.1 creatininase family protein [Paludisphaera mucosa]